MILLTSIRPNLNILELGETSQRDTWAPVKTLLNVRDVLWEEAVTRTISTVDPKNADKLESRASPAQRGEVGDWKATLVEIDDQSFTLSLGWRISNSTHDIVSRMMGRAGLCTADNISRIASSASTDSTKSASGRPRISEQTLLANSCVMKSIINLIRGPSR
jgi:hypothetical protein